MPAPSSPVSPRRHQAWRAANLLTCESPPGPAQSSAGVLAHQGGGDISNPWCGSAGAHGAKNFAPRCT